MASPTVGAVWLNVLPSMQSFPRTLGQQASSAAKTAGARAGQGMGEALAEETGRTAARRMPAASRRMAATFTQSTTVMTRGLANFRAGFASVDAAASGFTGRMGSLGGATARGLDAGVVSTQNLAAGFMDSAAAASAFTGRLGSVGGAVRRAITPAETSMFNLVAGFRDSSAAASAFTGRLGTLGGIARSAVQPAADAVGRFRDGFTSAGAAASVFSGRMGTVGGLASRALGGAATAARSVGVNLSAASTAASSVFGRVRSGATSAFGVVRSAGASAAGAVRGGFSRMAASAQASQSGVGGLGAALTSMGAVGAAAVGAIGLAGLGRTAVTAALDIQQTSASMSGLYGSTAKAEDMMRRLREYSRNTPLETQSLYEAGKNLAYLGLEGNSAMKVVQNVGTALQASGNTSQGAMTQVTGALLSMQSAGQLYAADIQRVSDQMVPAWDLLSAHMGMSIKDVRKEVTEGKLTVNDFVAALQAGEGDYFAMMRKSATKTSQTFKAQFAIVKDNITTTLGETLLPLVDRASPALGRLGGAVNSGLQGIPGMLASAKKTLDSSGLTAAFSSMGAGLKAVFVGSGPLVSAFAGTFATAVGSVLLVLRPLGSLLQSVGGWMQNNQGVVRVLGAALAGAAVAMLAIRTATMLWSGAMAILNVVMSANPVGIIVIAIAALVAGVIYAYKNFEGFRTAVNAVGSAIKTAALWIWDNGLKPAFAGIMIAVRAVGAAAMWLWTNAIMPAFGGIRTAVTFLGTVAMWLWSTVLSPVFSFIGAAVRLLAVIITTIFVAPAVIAFNILSAAAMWLWTNAIAPAFRAIGALAMWLWTNALLPAWNGIKAGIRAVGAVFKWLYVNIVKPVFGWIKLAALVWWTGVKVIFAAVRTYIIGPLGAVFRWLYNAVIRPVFTWIKTMVANWWRGVKIIFAAVRTYIIGPLGSVFRWLWNNVIRPVWNGIRATISAVWNGGIKPIFNRLKDGVKAIWKAFQSAKGYIKTAWKGIRDSAKKPVNFLIDTVYNNGIRTVWNKVAGIVGASKIGKAKGFARGGILPGTSSWRQGDDQLVPMRRGEGVYVSEVMRDPYERARLAMMNGAAIRGTPPASVRAKLGHELGEGAGHFAKGGVVGAGSHARTSMSGSGFAKGGWLGVKDISPSKDGILGKVGKFVKDVAISTFTGDFGGAVDSVFKPMKTATKKFGTEGLPGTPYMAVGKLHKLTKTYLVDKWDSFMAAFGGGGGGEWVGLGSASERLRRAAKWAQTQHGKPYQWGGGGNPSWDCSGFMAGIENVIRGIRPGRRYTTHSFGGSPPGGWQRNLKSPFTVGVQHGGRGGGHMAGTLLGKNVESGGRGVQVGASARGTNTFPNRFGFKPVVGDLGKKSDAGKGASHGRASTFDSGGYLNPGLTFNGTRKPEPVLTETQWRDMHRIAETVAGRDGGDLMRDAHIHLHNSESTVQQAFNRVDLELRKRRRGGVYAGRGA